MDAPAHTLPELVSNLRAAGISIQHLHWTVSGQSFEPDHVRLGAVYDTLNSALDSVAERAMGLGLTVPTAEEQAKRAYTLAKRFEVKTLAQAAELLTEITGQVNMLAADSQMSAGTQNLLAGIADDLEKHLYFLRRRLQG